MVPPALVQIFWSSVISCPWARAGGSLVRAVNITQLTWWYLPVLMWACFLIKPSEGTSCNTHWNNASFCFYHVGRRFGLSRGSHFCRNICDWYQNIGIKHWNQTLESKIGIKHWNQKSESKHWNQVINFHELLKGLRNCQQQNPFVNQTKRISNQALTKTLSRDANAPTSDMYTSNYPLSSFTTSNQNWGVFASKWAALAPTVIQVAHSQLG